MKQQIWNSGGMTHNRAWLGRSLASAHFAAASELGHLAQEQSCVCARLLNEDRLIDTPLDFG
jgi:hypothetical protein